MNYTAYVITGLIVIIFSLGMFIKSFIKCGCTNKKRYYIAAIGYFITFIYTANSWWDFIMWTS